MLISRCQVVHETRRRRLLAIMRFFSCLCTCIIRLGHAAMEPLWYDTLEIVKRNVGDSSSGRTHMRCKPVSNFQGPGFESSYGAHDSHPPLRQVAPCLLKHEDSSVVHGPSFWPVPFISGFAADQIPLMSGVWGGVAWLSVSGPLSGISIVPSGNNGCLGNFPSTLFEQRMCGDTLHLRSIGAYKNKDTYRNPAWCWVNYVDGTGQCPDSERQMAVLWSRRRRCQSQSACVKLA